MDYVLKIIPQMLDGCIVSAQVFFITIVLSIPLGVLLSLGRIQHQTTAKNHRLLCLDYAW